VNGDPVVALVLSPREWATRLHRHAVDHGGVQVKARILRGEEVNGAEFEVLVVDDTTSFLSRRLIDKVHGAGSEVLGVYDGDDFPEGRQRLLDLGVDAVIEAASEAEEFVRRIGEMRSVATTFPTVRSTSERAPWSLIVVGGPFGGTGSTEVAIALAARFHGRGHRTVLIDADDVAPSIAQRLGIPVVPNLRTVVDQSRRGVDVVTDTSWGFDIVCGIPNPRDWLELRPADVSAAIEDLGSRADVVVADISSGIERLPGDGRFRLARKLMVQAGVLVGVGVPTPTGVSRLLDWVAEAEALNRGAKLLLALNRAPTGGFLRSEVAREIERVFDPATIEFLPEDRRVRRAAWEGSVVRRGGFARGVAAVASGSGDPW
jgi:MinD-like ATPase involved in chromosome partitioning or flagellar assembly